MQTILRMIKAAQQTRGTLAERMQALSIQFENALPRELADVLNEVGAISDEELAHIQEHGFDLFPDARPLVLYRVTYVTSTSGLTLSEPTEDLDFAVDKLLKLRASGATADIQVTYDGGQRWTRMNSDEYHSSI